jgi:hypothetical protein
MVEILVIEFVFSHPFHGSYLLSFFGPAVPGTKDFQSLKTLPVYNLLS